MKTANRILLGLLISVFWVTTADAVVTTFKWLPPEGTVIALTTQLDGLPDGTFSAVSSVFDNETDLYQYMSCELTLASLSPAAGAFTEVWIEYSLDGTNYADHGKVLQTSGLLATFQLDTAAASAQRLVRTGIPIFPLKFKLAVRNKAGVALGATTNTLKCRRHNEQGL